MAILTLPVNEIVAAYKAGKTLHEIATVYGCSDWAIKHRLLQAGENLRRTGPARTYALNESFFEDIQTEQQAYWLGFLLADARVAKSAGGNWICRTDLGATDRGHLEKLQCDVATDAPIHTGHDGKSVYLDLCSARLCRSLVLLECGPDKTSKHSTPIVPAVLQHHFYRGFSDGDGSIYACPASHSWKFDVLGSPLFITELQRWLVQHAGVGYTKLSTPNNSPVSLSVRYTGGKQVERICRTLYANATVYLQRKFDSVQRLYARNKVPGGAAGTRSRHIVEDCTNAI